MAQVTNAYKYANSPTVYGTVNGQQYAFSNANDFTSLGGSFNDVQTKDGLTSPNANIPIYSSQSSTPILGSIKQPDSGLASTSIQNGNTGGGSQTPTSTLGTSGNLAQIGQGFQDVTSGKQSAIGALTGQTPQPPQQPVPTGQQTNYTLNGITYNPQGEVVSGGGQSSQPQMQTSAQNIQPANMGALSNGTQTYKMGDGSIVDASTGQIISQPGQNVTTSGGGDISASIPGQTTPSTSLGNAPGNNAILSSLNSAYANEQSLFSNLSNYATVPPSEIALQQQVAQAQGNVGEANQALLGLQAEAGGAYNPSGNPDLAFVTGAARNAQFGAQQNVISAQLQQQIAQTNLAYAQGNRQFAFNSASTIFNASRNNLADMISIYQAAAPKNIATNYNPLTGQVNTTMINPLSGETYEVDNGNIGASQPLQNVSTQINPLNGQLTITGTGPTGKPITYSMDSNGVITGNSLQGGSQGSSQGQPGSLVSSNINPQAVVGGYDLTSYAGASSATGTYGQTVNSLYQNMPTISNSQDAQSYINSVNKNSPITGDMVMQASQKYGVDPKVMMAVMQEESSMGTAGMATSTFNPGNVGNNSDSGKKTNWGSWQAGVNAVAHNLQERQINPVQQASTGSMTQNASSPQEVIQQVVSSLPSTIRQAVNYLPDGTPYIDENLTKGNETAAQVLGDKVGIKAIDANSASKLQTITTTQKDLSDFQTKADAALSSVGWGANYLNAAKLWLGNKITGDTTLNDFQSFRTSAISALESLASGAGSGFRITQGELNTAIDNVPTSTDTKSQADEKIAALNAQMNNWVSTIYPGWIPPQ